MTDATIRRLLLVLAISGATAFLTWHTLVDGTVTPDLDPVLAGSRLWWAGDNPYTAIGPDRAVAWTTPLFYPFPALLIVSPIAWLPHPWPEVLFLTGGTALLAWGLTARTLSSPALLVFVSVPFIQHIPAAQWTPWIMGAALLPSWRWLWAAKPPMALGLWLWKPTWSGLLLPALVLVVSLAIWPTWPQAWLLGRDATGHYTAPLLRPWGWLIGLSLLRWRDPDARLLLGLAVVPHGELLYDALPLFLLAETWAVAWLLWALGWLVWIAITLQGPYPDVYTMMDVSGAWIVWGLYLPLTALVVLRPYVGSIRMARNTRRSSAVSLS